MTKLVVTGGRELSGEVRISAAKNAVLPIIAAALAGRTPSVIEEVPRLVDVLTLADVLRQLGVGAEFAGDNLVIDPQKITSCEAPYEHVRRMRASFLVMGPLLAREGWARIALPGGCAIGSRPIDLHLKGFEALGAEIIHGHGFIEARARNGLHGANIYLDFPSVGATENIIMAAVLADGHTVLENPAQEPEIIDLANFLNNMGAKVRGAGTDTIRIEGVGVLKGVNYTVIPDRVEAGTYMVAVAMAGGEVRLTNVLPEHMKPVTAKLREVGVTVAEDIDNVLVKSDRRLLAVDIKTLPYPGFPTDMQAQFMAMLSVASGVSSVQETVFENRFMHVDELRKFGASILVEGRVAKVFGVNRLAGARVKATDLRAGAAMVLAGMVADGETEVDYVHHIDRGYDRLVEKLCRIGGQIRRTGG
ncbi:MAG: UDP-N-acetylglucosamine 1-carboxyvinyltransferase [Negativicutes bacterium]|nr:UDP-N-acetylglucosamine 1-carboxyvinyltransferase [Negativicutes bacterium]